MEHFLIYFQFLEGCYIFYHLLFFTHFTRGNASLRSLPSLPSLRAPVLFRGSPKRPSAWLKKNAQCSRSVSNLHFDFQPRALSFFCVIFFSLSSPHIIFLSQSVLHAGSSSSAENGLSLCGSRICHEIAHAWFGLVIGAKDWTEEWISEGFATYLEDIIWAKAQKVQLSLHCLIAADCSYSSK